MMKKLLLSMLLLIAVCCGTVCISAAQADCYDVNRDGTVSIGDVSTLLSFLAYQTEFADVNGDGVMSIGDVSALLSYLARPTDPTPTYSEGLQYRLSRDGSHYTVTGIGSCTDRELVIPPVHPDDGIPITEIDLLAFYGCTELTALTVSDRITTIGYGAFGGCTGLTEITLENGITALEEATFYNCTSLRTLHLPATLTRIEKDAFSGCAQLSRVTLPAGLESIGKSAFAGCNKLVEVYNLSALPLTLGSSDYGAVCANALAIYSDAAAPGRQFTDPSGYQFFDDGDKRILFGYIGAADRLVLPADCNGKPYQIHQNAFRGCTELRAVRIPQGVHHIGDAAFSGCSSLETAELPEGLAQIGKEAFFECYALTGITLPASLTSIGEDAFRNCFKLVEIYDLSALQVQRGSTDCGYVGYYALGINRSADSLSRVFTDAAGYRFYRTSSEYYLLGYTGKEHILTLPEDCREQPYLIYPYAFYENRQIESVWLSDGVTSVEAYAFGNCVNLQTVHIGDRVSAIESGAFSGCTSLREIEIPDRVYKLGSYAFYKCSSLRRVTVGTGLLGIGNAAFYGCKALQSVTFAAPEGWYQSEDSNATEGTALVLTDPASNATELRGAQNVFWLRA